MSTMTLDDTLSSEDACELTGITYRQLDHWCRVGYLGPHLVGRGSGSQRRFTAHDVEVLDAVRALRLLGCLRSGADDAASRAREQALIEATSVVRSRPVAAEGEYLVVTLDPPRAQRFDHVCIDAASGIVPPLWVVPLRSFSTIALPAGESDVPAGRSHLLPAGSGAVDVEALPARRASADGSTFT